ncbi:MULTISPECIES: citryl-CoA lyase [unclassified Methanobrevibacter]|jgi:citrate synthase|uniref:citryl-CoA lyase n=1 Tax=Methanobrevibacter TaxID=2172 RepID=UPI0025E10AD0|nr:MULTISPECIES: citryl-CoA lyase [unclassified Methanobrevibacter]MEE0941782.1 citryl-CoA lyase [Methanobrevibacter sp.]
MSENNFRVSPRSLKTTISKVETDKIITRGYNQRDLIEKIRYSDMIYLLLKGKLPSIKEGKIFNHVLVSFCDHGVTPPSTQTARLVASSGSPINSAVAGALLSFGHKHAGAIQKTMELYQSKINSLYLTEDSALDNKQIASLAIDIYNEYILGEKKIPGFGHRYHNVDPRADKLMDIVIKEGFVGPHIKLALAVEDLAYQKKGIRLNVDGANAAILSDLGFDPETGLGIFIIGRIPGIIAHINEEKMEEEEFRRFCDLDDIEYYGR